MDNEQSLSDIEQQTVKIGVQVPELGKQTGEPEAFFLEALSTVHGRVLSRT